MRGAQPVGSERVLQVLDRVERAAQSDTATAMPTPTWSIATPIAAPIPSAMPSCAPGFMRSSCVNSGVNWKNRRLVDTYEIRIEDDDLDQPVAAAVGVASDAS